MEDPKINVSPDEIVIVIPEDANEDELVIDLEELGIDLEQLGDEITLPNEWYFDDDPYGIVYYEYVR